MIPTEWTAALFGGVLIGLSAAIYLLATGRIAGISGIVGGLIQYNHTNDSAIRIAFLVGLIGGPLLLKPVLPIPAAVGPDNLVIVVVAGLLVGFGTRLGSGCTSGHGVCGMSRMSPRSIAATAIFMGFGIATVFVTRHVMGIV